MTIELHTWNTPNGRKISVALEEMGLPYKVFPINITKGEQMAPEFLAISPNNKIPAIVDPDGPGGKRVSVFESGAILLYLGEKTGKFLPQPLIERIPVYEWLMWQMGGFGPMPGQVHHFIALENEAGPRLWPEALYGGDAPALRRAGSPPRGPASLSPAPCRSPTLPFSAGPGGTRATRWSFRISPMSGAGTTR